MRTTLALLVAGGFGLSAGCGGGETRDDSARLPRARHHNLDRTGTTVHRADLNRDGETDQWVYRRDGQLVWAERDIDFNGRIDIWEHFDAEGRLVEQEMNLDFDDQIDVVRSYRDDALRRRELATGFDGRFEMVKYYDGEGNVLRVERDSDDDGRMDTWEYFDDNEVVRVGHDTDGDGTPEFDDSP